MVHFCVHAQASSGILMMLCLYIFILLFSFYMLYGQVVSSVLWTSPIWVWMCVQLCTCWDVNHLSLYVCVVVYLPRCRSSKTKNQAKKKLRRKLKYWRFSWWLNKLEYKLSHCHPNHARHDSNWSFLLMMLPNSSEYKLGS